MREFGTTLGVGLLLLGVAAFLWLAVLTGPHPEWACGGGPNLGIAVFGYNADGDLEDACRGSAAWESIKGVAVGGALVGAGIGFTITGRGARRRGPAPAYGQRSPDGRWWWDGSAWRPVDAPRSF